MPKIQNWNQLESGLSNVIIPVKVFKILNN